MVTEDNHIESVIWDWWKKRRKKYNIGLVIAGITAFILYVILGATLIMPYDNQFEITLFTIAFQAFGYLFMMLFANLFYFTGYVVDMKFNINNDEKYRQRLFNIGYWFSFGLPFLIPLMIILMYFIKFSHLN